MKDKGFIVLYRKFLDWEWFNDINTCHLFLYFLLRANYQDTQWRGITVKKGQFITSYTKLSEETGLTYKQVRLSLDKLKRTGEVAHEGQSQYSIITVNNWDKYQIEGQTEGQTEGRRRATNKKDNNTNYINSSDVSNFKKPTLEEVKNYISEKNLTIDPERFFYYYEANGWTQGNKKMKSWTAAAHYWQRTEKKPEPEEETDEEFRQRVDEIFRQRREEEQRELNGQKGIY